MFGTEAQKARFLPPLATGEMLGAWGLTEPSAGSDAAGTRTVAVRDGDTWVLNGAKTFITHGKIGGVMVVMAVTDRTKGNRGISAFIVPHGTPGMRAGKKENKLGMRASDTSEVIFTDCRVPADAQLGEDGQGFVNALQVLDAGRTGIAALAVGLARAFDAPSPMPRAAVSSASRSPTSRPRSSSSPISHSHRRRAPADAARRAHAGSGLRTTRESAEAKLFASEVAVKAADECVQIHGGYGFVKDYPAEKYFRDVKLLTIGEGTSEIQRMVIARQLLA